MSASVARRFEGERVGAPLAFRPAGLGRAGRAKAVRAAYLIISARLLELLHEVAEAVRLPLDVPRGGVVRARRERLGPLRHLRLGGRGRAAEEVLLRLYDTRRASRYWPPRQAEWSRREVGRVGALCRTAIETISADGDTATRDTEVSDAGGTKAEESLRAAPAGRGCVAQGGAGGPARHSAARSAQQGCCLTRRTRRGRAWRTDAVACQGVSRGRSVGEDAVRARTAAARAGAGPAGSAWRHTEL